MLYNGKGVEKDYAKAVYWYIKAAEQGDAEAQLNLGLCYYNGEGVSRDFAKAAYWLGKSAEQGIAGAQLFLGQCYDYGEGVSEDKVKAEYWYTKAAEQGDAYAQYKLGFLFEQKQDYNKAIYWLEKAVKAEYDFGFNGETMLLLATIYYNSPNKMNHYEKAVKYLNLAKESFNDDISGVACNMLSKCYRFGRGVPKDINKANELQAEAESKGCGGDINELIKKLKEEYSIIK